MATSTTTRRRKSAPLSREERSARVEALAAKYEEFAESVDDDEAAEYAARFDYYSEKNAMLIVMQNPDATVVRAYGAWKAEGRQVRKGETGIQIFAPAGAFQVEDRNAPVGDDGQPGKKTIQKFKVVFVFDISQTDLIGATVDATNDDELEAAAA